MVGSYRTDSILSSTSLSRAILEVAEFVKTRCPMLRSFACSVHYSLETEFQAGRDLFDGTSGRISAAGFGHTKTVATMDSLVVAIADLGGLRG